MNDPLAGTIIAERYELQERLGEGGAGVAYKALDRTLERTVVLKQIPRNPETEARLQKEMHAVASLTSAYIVPLIDIVIGDEETVSLVSEYVEGASLEEILANGPLTTVDALAVAVAVSKALLVAHAKGFLHRDLKPSNVLIPKGDQFDQARLADFGAFGQIEQDTGTTVSGQLFGTPLWMSPEQLRSEPQSVATDLHGLGLLLYAMLYGKSPYADMSMPDLFIRIMSADITLPDQPALPAELKTLLQQLLSKPVLSRPQSSKEVAEKIKSLQQFLSSKDDDQSWRDTTQSAAITGAFDWGNVTSSQPMPTPTVELPAATAKPSRHVITLLVLGLLITVSIAVAVTFWFGIEPNTTIFTSRFMQLAVGVILGVTMGVIGVLLALQTRRFLGGLKPDIADKASQLLHGISRRDWLTRTLTVEIDELINRCRSIDQRILGRTLAIMLDEFKQAEAPSDRANRLNDVVSISVQLIDRLTPWYIRYEKLLAFLVGISGLVSGGITAFQVIVAG